MPLASQVEDLVTRIHDTPHKAVLAFAGAGSQALAWLHGVGGSSRTILTALDIYGSQSMNDLLGFMPAKFTSRRVARLMASAAYDLAREYMFAAAAENVAGVPAMPAAETLAGASAGAATTGTRTAASASPS